MASQDSLLLARMARGDAAALEHLRARHWRAAYEVAYGLLADSAAAVHAVSEAFLEAFRSAGRFDPTTADGVETWLSGLARQRALALADAHRVPRSMDPVTRPWPRSRRDTPTPRVP